VGCSSHVFRRRNRSCSEIIESGNVSGNFSNLRIRLLVRLRLVSIQPKFAQVNFWRCKRFLPEIPQTCPKSCATFNYEFPPTKIMKTFFWCDLQKQSFVFLQTLKSNNAVPCCPDLEGFCQVLRDFAQIFWDSRIFDKSELWACDCTPVASCTTVRNNHTDSRYYRN